MKIPDFLINKIPNEWLDDTFVRDHVVDECNKKIDTMVTSIFINKIDYFSDDERLADLMIEHFDVEQMTENEFGYILQNVVAKCALVDLVNAGYAKQINENEWAVTPPWD